jgi:uncharacterized RDD family membrane protein YckC
MSSWLYEGLLLFGVLFIPAYLFSTLSQSRHALTNRTALQAFMFVVLGIYFVWFWHRGQTLPMKTWRMRLVDASGHPPSQARAALRYLCAWLWVLPPLAASALLGWQGGKVVVALSVWIALWAMATRLHPSRQFWHDALAGTRMVQLPPPAGKP